MNNYQRLVDEYIGFEEETLEKDSREVYSMAGQIKFYNDVMNYLEYGDIKVRELEKIKSLKDLYKVFCIFKSSYNIVITFHIEIIEVFK